MKSIFTIADISDENIVLKVNCNSTLVAAKHPYVDMNDDYISVTRGDDHIMSIIHKDGSAQRFHFGANGHTIIGKELELLKSKVLNYLHENHILIQYQGEPLRAANIFYNKNYKQWELSMDKATGVNSVKFFSKKANSIDEMIEECLPFVEAESWDKGKAMTGIDIWFAKNPSFNILSTERKALQQATSQEKASFERG